MEHENKIPSSEKVRKHYIDNVRWACILMLIPFHAAMVWCSWGEKNYIWIRENKIFSSLIVTVSPWYMALLFVLAGISARYSLKRRTYRMFLWERVRKLLIPLITGMLTVVAVMTFYADCFFHHYKGDFLSHYIPFLTTFTDLTGYDGAWTPGHLWFLLYLFIISLLCLLVIALQRKLFPSFQCKNIGAGIIMLLGILPLIVYPILNFGGKSIGTYLVLFLLGYYVIFEDEVMEKIVQYRYLNLFILIIADVAYVYLFIWAENANGILMTVVMAIASWFGILTVLGFAKGRFNQNNKVTRYLTKHSFLIYIFHFMWLIIVQYYLFDLSNQTVLFYVISVIGAYILTFLSVEIVSRIPGVRWLYGVTKSSKTNKGR